VRLADDPLWYKDAIIYELHVRAFYDSNANGVGDFRGLTQKLDYLQDLGVTALWLLPFCPSPLKDDGYDMADYTDVHPLYGTLADFEFFLREAHQRRRERLDGEVPQEQRDDDAAGLRGAPAEAQLEEQRQQERDRADHQPEDGATGNGGPQAADLEGT